MRIFTFGCSFTSYDYPTWANMIGAENWALPGAGNVFIANRIFQCDMVNTITDDDTIIVEWSLSMREDRMKGGIWQTHGSVYSSPFYRDCEKYWDEGDALNKSLMSIYYVNERFKNHPNFYQTTIDSKQQFIEDLAVADFANQHEKMTTLTNTLLNRYQWIEGMGEYFKRTTNSDFDKIRLRYNNGQCEHHPLPMEHLDWVSEQFPELVTHESNILAIEYQRLAMNLDRATMADTWYADPRRNQVSGFITK